MTFLNHKRLNLSERKRVQQCLCEVGNGSCFWFCSLFHCNMNNEVSAVLDFNASINASVPSAPISLTACLCWLLAMSAIHPSLSLSSCSRLRLRDWSDVFVFNASLSALAPSSPIPLTACSCLLLAMFTIHLPHFLLDHLPD